MRTQLVNSVAHAILFNRVQTAAPSCKVGKTIWDEAKPDELAAAIVSLMRDDAVEYLRGLRSSNEVVAAEPYVDPAIYEQRVNMSAALMALYIGKSDKTCAARQISHQKTLDGPSEGHQQVHKVRASSPPAAFRALVLNSLWPSHPAPRRHRPPRTISRSSPIGRARRQAP